MRSRAERIDEIPWAELRHADGSAENLRPLVHQLFDPAAELARDALMRLSAHLCYEEHFVYDATVAGIPFLVEAYLGASGPLREGLAATLSEIGSVVTPWSDPWRAVHGLPGARRLLGLQAKWRDQPDGPATRRALFQTLPLLLEQASDEPTLGHGLCAKLARAPEEQGALALAILVREHARATGRARLFLLRALVELGAVDEVSEPVDRFEHWVWLAAEPTRAARLADVVVHARDEDLFEYASVSRGRDFWAELAVPLVLARPELQPAVARRLVRHRVTQAAASDSPHHPYVGSVDFLLVFPEGRMPAELESHQLELLDMAYRAAFHPRYTNGNQLDPIRAIGAPSIRAQASTFLASRGRAPLR